MADVQVVFFLGVEARAVRAVLPAEAKCRGGAVESCCRSLGKRGRPSPLTVGDGGKLPRRARSVRTGRDRELNSTANLGLEFTYCPGVIG